MIRKKYKKDNSERYPYSWLCTAVRLSGEPVNFRCTIKLESITVRYVREREVWWSD